MSNNLRDQLMGLGFKPAPRPERPARPAPAQKPAGAKPQRDAARNADARRRQQDGKPAQARPHTPHTPRPSGKAGAQKSREDIDLAKAYAIRAQREKDERIAAEAAKQDEARRRREARAQLADLVKDKGLNVADAEIARHFEYGGKIKRVYVTAPQLKQLNAGELGVLQMDGRYLLVDAALLAQAETVFPPAVALKVDPAAPAGNDPYADPQYQVPDDLVW